MREFVIHIRDLDNGGKDYQFEISNTWLTHVLADAQLRPSDQPGRFAFHAQRSGRDILVKGKLEAKVLTECSRCLGDVPLSVETSVVSMFSPSSAGLAHGRDEEVLVDEPDRDVYTGDEVVLDDIMREHILLEIPMQPLCSNDCRGIEIPAAVRGGKDANKEDVGKPVDPRLAPLMRFARPRGQREE